MTALDTPPKPRHPKKRLPDEARVLEPGGYIDAPDTETAICVRAFGRSHRWRMVQRKAEGIIRVWRLK